jgi:hypothetical protein
LIINANRTLSRINAKRMPRAAAPLPPRSGGGIVPLTLPA